MAKAKTTKKAAPKAKKAAKPKSGPSKTAKIRAKASDAGHKGYEALAKLADHPLVADLLAVGAMAAVAAIAGDKGKLGASARVTSKSVKDAGKAAATAIGQRLLDEYKGIKKTAKKSAAKRVAKKA